MRFSALLLAAGLSAGGLIGSSAPCRAQVFHRREMRQQSVGMNAGANAYDAELSQEEGIGVNAGNNAFYSVTNQINGVSLIQASKLSVINGGQFWSVYYNPGYSVFATAAATDPASDLFVIGTARPQGSLRQVLVLKYSPDGGLLWDYVYPSERSAVPTAAATDADGNLFVALSTNLNGGTELQVIKLSPQRGLLGVDSYDQGATNYGDQMSVDADGNVVMQVHSTYGNGNSGSYQTQRVLFFANSAGWRPL